MSLYQNQQSVGQPATFQSYSTQGTQTRTKAVREGPRPIPAWAFWTVVVIAIIFIVLAGTLWYYTSVCHQSIYNHTACPQPTVQVPTCNPVTQTTGAVLPPCTTACVANSDCPAIYTGGCVNSICVRSCTADATCLPFAPTCNTGTMTCGYP
jgi:hypothetical protein